MSTKRPTIADVLRRLRHTAVTEVAAAGLTAPRARLRVGLRLEVGRDGAHWVPCIGTETAQHAIEVEVDCDANADWWSSSAEPAVLGGASDAEQLEHRLREEFEQLTIEQQDPQTRPVVKKAPAVRKKVAAKKKVLPKKKAAKKKAAKKKAAKKKT